MKFYSDYVQDDEDRPIPGVQVLVLNRDGSLASLTNATGQPDNPTKTDGFGRFEFYAPEGVYDAEFRYGGSTIRQDSLIVGNPPQFKGNPGGNAMAIGTFAEARVAAFSIPAGYDRVRTSGSQIVGVGAADYVRDAAYYVPGATNLLSSSNDFTTAPWFGSDPVFGSASFDGTYSTLSDTNPAGYVAWSQTVTTDASIITAEMLVAKDAVGAAVRQPILRVDFEGDTSPHVEAIIDTAAGTIADGSAHGSASPALDLAIEDAGPDWRVILTGQKPAGTSLAIFRIFPAESQNLTSSAALQGSIRVRGAKLYAGVSEHYQPDPYTTFLAADGSLFRLALDQTITPFHFGAVGNGSDDAVAVQNYFDFISRTAVPDANWGGSFAHSQPLFVGPATGIMATGRVDGFLHLYPTGTMAIALTARNVANCNFGHYQCHAPGSAAFATRAVGLALKLRGESGRASFASVKGNNLIFGTVASVSEGDDNSNFTRFGLIQGISVGSGSGNSGGLSSLLTNWSWMSDIGPAGSYSQSTTLQVDTMPPTMLESIASSGLVPWQLRINGQTYWVQSYDRAAGTVRVKPWLPSANRAAGQTGTARWIFGARLAAAGNNALLYVDVLDGATSGRALLAGSAFGPHVGLLSSTSDAQGILLGAYPLNGNNGCKVEKCYFEANTVAEEICTLSGQATMEIQEATNTNPARWTDCSGPRNADDSMGTQSGGSGGYAQVGVSAAGRRYEWQRGALQYGDPGTISINSASQNARYYSDAVTVNLKSSGAPLSTTMGYTGCRLTVIGTGPNNTPTSPIVFNAPAGGMVNGTTSVALVGSKFDVQVVDAANLTWFVSAQPLLPLVGTAPVAGGTIAPGAAPQTVTVNVVGAAVGNEVALAYSASRAGVIMDGEVTAPGVVTVQYYLPSNYAAAVTLPAGVVTAKVRKTQ